MIIDSAGYTVIEWADYVGSEFNGPIPRLDRPEDWKLWARSLIELPQVRGQLPPNPNDYAYWKDWADDFNKAVRY